jgi:DNA-binding transcriptional MerR regulator
MAGPMSVQVAERRYEKSPLAYRTISEVASDLDVPQHVLRFWETKFTQIRPLKRGGGRRYYRPEDVDLLRRIRNLLYDEGYTIKGVQRLLRERSSRGNAEAEPAAKARAQAAASAAPTAGALAMDLHPPATVGDNETRRELKSVLADLEAALHSLRARVKDA